MKITCSQEFEVYVLVTQRTYSFLFGEQFLFDRCVSRYCFELKFVVEVDQFEVFGRECFDVFQSGWEIVFVGRNSDHVKRTDQYIFGTIFPFIIAGVDEGFPREVSGTSLELSCCQVVFFDNAPYSSLGVFLSSSGYNFAIDGMPYYLSEET